MDLAGVVARTPVASPGGFSDGDEEKNAVEGAEAHRWVLGRSVRLVRK